MDDTHKRIAMGYIKGVYGIKGWLKVKADTEYGDSLFEYPQWYLRKDDKVITVALEDGRLAGDELQVKFVGVEDRDAAALLRGYTVEIPRSEFADTEKDEYYWADLIGMQVVNREGVVLGSVHNLMQTGAHDVLVVRGAHGEKLIPFVSHYVDGVDSLKETITVDWGLDY